MRDERREEAARLMEAFAERTGLTGGASRRYLWTDAFAVCNFLELERLTGEPRYGELARRLVDDVHETLGKYRPDDARRGWISGLDEERGAHHPTKGGLRIGKPLSERRADESFDERLEWDRDGQYFHYLTKWMHALDALSRATCDWRFNQWARELAETAFEAFTYLSPGGGPRRMYWKMSTDLSRPLVPSMGLHDPLDGLVTCLQLDATASWIPLPPPVPRLDAAIAELAAMVDPSALATSDPLGLGGLLADAARLAQIGDDGGGELLRAILSAAFEGLRSYSGRDLGRPASERLAFRELGLAIGLQALTVLREHLPRESEVVALVDRLWPYPLLGVDIEAFWRDPDHRRSPTWAEHRDINEVMLATSLVPEGFLVLRRPSSAPA